MSYSEQARLIVDVLHEKFTIDQEQDYRLLNLYIALLHVQEMKYERGIEIQLAAIQTVLIGCQSKMIFLKPPAEVVDELDLITPAPSIESRFGYLKMIGITSPGAERFKAIFLKDTI